MKKKITSLVLVLSMSVCGLTFNNNVEAARGEAIDMNGWKVQWSEEFDGNSLNKNTWNVEVNGYGGWNNELQYYNGDADTIKVNNGTLKITANKKNVSGIDENGQTKQYNYTSGRINTENKITLGNGRIEAKIKLPIFNGTFPAFWLMGGNGLRWPECGEIDIMEAVNTENV